MLILLTAGSFSAELTASSYTRTCSISCVHVCVCVCARNASALVHTSRRTQWCTCVCMPSHLEMRLRMHWECSFAHWSQPPTLCLHAPERRCVIWLNGYSKHICYVRHVHASSIWIWSRILYGIIFSDGHVNHMQYNVLMHLLFDKNSEKKTSDWEFANFHWKYIE